VKPDEKQPETKPKEEPAKKVNRITIFIQLFY
jgi:hypothetical protein